MRGVVVAGVRSGCGKTTVALGLMAALGARGLKVQPYKVGPDFIDPGHHRTVTGRESHNLDGWMCGRHAVEDIFARAAQGADLAVVEGVMGLLDGVSGATDAGSTAEIATWLGLPVILVVDTASMARSAAAVAAGFAAMAPGLNWAGVICNNVASENHRELLAEAFASLPQLPVLGYLPRAPEQAMAARHLGLVTAQDAPLGPEQVAALGQLVAAHCDLEGLLARLPELDPQPPADVLDPAPVVRLGVAQDQAFCFVYPENLRLLRAAGAELVPFSPLEEKRLPQGLHGLYLPGGYPEVHALALANNAGLRKEIRRFIASGKPVWAECGGFMYLTEGIVNAHGQNCPMVGVFPLRARMAQRRIALGYRQITLEADGPLGPAGTMARGHEFHYSHPEGSLDTPPVFLATDRRGRPTPSGNGHAVERTVASYVHLHLASNPDLAGHLVRACLPPKP